jgi:DNA-nicking Smr family endonuclease
VSAADPSRDDETHEFREAMSGVRRQPPANHVAPRAAPPEPLPRQTRADELAVLREMMEEPEVETLESGDTLSYRAPGIQDSVLRRLRRGHYRIEREVDLHGLNRDRARGEVARFIAECREQDLRVVRIIHGKGNGSPNSGPVLKRQLDGWLRRHRDVLAFCSARPVDGGTGAVYVLLRGA